MNLPVVYNSSGYESVETIRRLDGYVDVYLPDMKYMEPELAAAFSNARDYPGSGRNSTESRSQRKKQPLILFFLKYKVPPTYEERHGQPMDYFDTFVEEWYDQGGRELTEKIREENS